MYFSAFLQAEISAVALRLDKKLKYVTKITSVRQNTETTATAHPICLLSI